MIDELFQLPETVDILGMTFFVNGITIMIALLPLLWIFFIGLYIVFSRKKARTVPGASSPLLLSDSIGNFYQFENAPASSLQASVKSETARSGPNHSLDSRYAEFVDDGIVSRERRTKKETAIDIGMENVHWTSESNDGFFVEDMTRPVKIPSFILSPVATLTCISQGTHLPETLNIGGDVPIRFGRRKSLCDHVIPDMRISRLHAAIIPKGNKLYIQDEGSSGGTFVNHRRVESTHRVLLKENDVVSFNDIAYRFKFVQ